MTQNHAESYLNLLDHCLLLEEQSGGSGQASDIFRSILKEYFFKEAVDLSKKLEQMIDELELPAFLKDYSLLYDVPLNEMTTFIQGNTVNDSLSGRIMLSKQYLEVFFSDHPPTFTKLPDEIKSELIKEIKEKNSNIITSIDKMKQDKEADKKRKILTLVSLMIKNLHKRTGNPIRELDRPVEDLIKGIYPNSHELFTAEVGQVNILMDDFHIKELIKAFFPVRKFDEIQELAELYKAEVARFKRRALLKP